MLRMPSCFSATPLDTCHAHHVGHKSQTLGEMEQTQNTYHTGTAEVTQAEGGARGHLGDVRRLPLRIRDNLTLNFLNSYLSESLIMAFLFLRIAYRARASHRTGDHVARSLHLTIPSGTSNLSSLCGSTASLISHWSQCFPMRPRIFDSTTSRVHAPGSKLANTTRRGDVCAGMRIASNRVAYPSNFPSAFTSVSPSSTTTSKSTSAGRPHASKASPRRSVCHRMHK
mmetsp:Transcript_78738/g.131454  ORF Transcript_78738/g.131454 Transcript_78738/m.131454 type:complete len:227 (+) Transcript_78738:1160-1840(+)